MYARGMTMREIQGYLAEMYGTEVSAEFISKVTDEVTAEITAWQSRPLEPMYPSQHHGADLHRTSHPQQPGLRKLERPQTRGRGIASDLYGGLPRKRLRRHSRNSPGTPGARSIQP